MLILKNQRLLPYTTTAIRTRICKLDNPAAFNQLVSVGCQLERPPCSPRGAATPSTTASGGRRRWARSPVRLPPQRCPARPAAEPCGAGPERTGPGRAAVEQAAGQAAAQPGLRPNPPHRAGLRALRAGWGRGPLQPRLCMSQ